MRKLKVALIIATLDRAGAEKQLVLLARGLDRQKFDPQVIALTRGGPNEAPLRQAGLPVTILGKSFKYDLRILPALRDLLRRQQIDVAMTWMFTANAFGRAAARWAGVPVIVAGEQDTGYKPPLHHWVDRRLAAHTDAIVANSEGVRQYGLGHGWPDAKVRVIFAGIDPAEVDLKRDLAGPLPQRPAGEPVLLSVCRLTRQKGLIYLMWAVGILKHAGVRVQLWIAGDGPERGRLEYEVDRMRVEGQVHFLGSRPDAVAIMRQVDLFVLPSLHEGMSNAVLEAMLVGTPVVVSDVAGMRELVDGGRYGMVVEPGYPKGIAAGVFQMLKYAERRRQMAEGGRDYVRRRFSVERFVTEHENLFIELARGKGLDV